MNMRSLQKKDNFLDIIDAIRKKYNDSPAWSKNTWLQIGYLLGRNKKQDFKLTINFRICSQCRELMPNEQFHVGRSECKKCRQNRI